MTPRKALREIIAGHECVMCVSVHDALSARLVERAGFRVMSISGNTVSASYLGMPDLAFITLPEMADVSRRIVNAVSIPVIVDADTGYGNAMMVARAVGEFERAGISGVMIEDQVEYKKCGMMSGGHPVIPIPDFLGKIRAACLARRDPDLVIIARTDAGADHGIEEALRRAKLSVEAGADMVEIAVRGDPEHLEAIRKLDSKIPLVANMDEGKRFSEFSLETLKDCGYRLAEYPGVIRYTMLKGMMDVLAHLHHHGSTKGVRASMASVQEFFEAVDLAHYKELEGKVLPSDQGSNSR